MADIWMCVGDIKGATEGKLFLSYGDVSKVVKEIRLISMDKKIKLFVNYEEINISFRKLENSYTVYEFKTKKNNYNLLRKLFKLEMKTQLGYGKISLDIFDDDTLYKIYTELLLYLYKVKTDELLIQFSTIIRYQLESLKMIYENKDLIDFDEELKQTVTQFRKIYEICSSMESKVELTQLDYRNKVIKERMEKRKEINKINILMLDEINKMKD